jgi:hypothetical protein
MMKTINLLDGLHFGAKWHVSLTKSASKDVKLVPRIVQRKVAILMAEIRQHGPHRRNWKNFSALSGMQGQNKTEKRWHCHIRAEKKAYVVFWNQFGEVFKIEVYDVGTHESFSYR